MRRIFAPLAVMLFCLGLPAAGSAATIVVNSAAANNSPAECTLPNAINAANTDAVVGTCAAGSGADLIQFALPSPSTISLTAELPQINGNLEIAGPGASALTISGMQSVRPFHVTGTANSISGLTIAKGKSVFGAGLWLGAPGALTMTGVVVRENEAIASGGENTFAEGGGIYSQGALTLVDSTIVKNAARVSGASAQNGASGGGIYSQSTASSRLVLDRTTVRDNQAVAISPGAGTTLASAGGIGNFRQLVLRNSVVSGNKAEATGSSTANSASGGGISNANVPAAVEVSIERSTLASNEARAIGVSASSSGGAFLSSGGVSFLFSSSTIAGNRAEIGANISVSNATQLRSTILAKPLGGPSCSGTPQSLGFNLSETAGCGLVAATDQPGVDPQLGPLADNGGPTESMALPITSPAIDKGVAGAGETTDQRGLPRPVDIAQLADAVGGDGSDIGAYEYQLPVARITGGPADGQTITDAEPRFDFTSDEAGATFLCALDGGTPTPCTSPVKAPRLADGTHTFSVTAVSTLGYSVVSPTTRTFTVEVRVPDKPGPPTTPVEPTRPNEAQAPRPHIGRVPKKTAKHRLRIPFSASVPGSTFQCKLDKRKWRGCRSPYETPLLSVGKHTFKLKAIGPTGLVEPTPAVKKFEVVAARS